MATTSLSSNTPSLRHTKFSPGGRLRRSPNVQELQKTCPYVNIYPLSSPERPDPTPVSHAHPVPSKWEGQNGHACRHINDSMPFSLWDNEKQEFRNITRDEMQFILESYQAEKIECQPSRIIIYTNNPPRPVPLTVACLPAVFTTPGYSYPEKCYGSAPYPNPRVPDPCPHLAWGRWKTPTKAQMVEAVEILVGIINVSRVNFFATSIVVEVAVDGRTYPSGSLPGVVAGLLTTYHHKSMPFFDSMKSHTRERLLDPRESLPGPEIGPLPQDATNYLREPEWAGLTPGVRVSTCLATDANLESDMILSTTCGVLLRKGPTKCVTVANHGFLQTNEVYHPTYDGDKVGDIVDRYPEIDLAMVQLTPANSYRFSNETYFQAETPRRLVGCEEIAINSWLEIDGMSTGLLSFNVKGKAIVAPVRPPGHPSIPVLKWELYTLSEIFGVINPKLMDGMCGAPIVEVETGNVAGFFHLGNGEFAMCAALDDLIAEGWEIC